MNYYVAEMVQVVLVGWLAFLALIAAIGFPILILSIGWVLWERFRD